MIRHPEIKTATPIPLELPRAKITQAIVDKWFSLFEQVINENNLIDKPFQIFNCDESGFVDKTDTTKVIVRPPGAAYNTSKNGWMEENVFYEWFKHLFIPQTARTPKPILLMLDGHTS
ncbi:unnamed protein product [Didymodactylos carnosus]|uniref:DDE-1 domain-containing protein n=1 Tax=Didymodactylos carnosus TaxID=1234261 RepID=A0A815GG97_9BILA|nr:unnamed protein product [Didymodactylos carnosus]CAF4196864.1 unnamed protein product [Didymodactylos carnosus]